jgi:hypothetical protein
MTEPAKPLDPWRDAAEIARRLTLRDAQLLVAIGAEAWCAKCRVLRPEFESHSAAEAPAHVVWFWLDLEDHAEFIGDFVPVDLPLLLRYRNGQLIQASVIEELSAASLRLRDVTKPGLKPSLWEVFCAKNWASQ